MSVGDRPREAAISSAEPESATAPPAGAAPSLDVASSASFGWPLVSTSPRRHPKMTAGTSRHRPKSMSARFMMSSASLHYVCGSMIVWSPVSESVAVVPMAAASSSCHAATGSP